MLIFDFPPPRVLEGRFRKEILFEKAAFQDKIPPLPSRPHRRQSAHTPSRCPSTASDRAFPTRTYDRQSAHTPSRDLSNAHHRAFPPLNPVGKARSSPPEASPNHSTALSLPVARLSGCGAVLPAIVSGANVQWIRDSLYSGYVTVRTVDRGQSV